MEDSWQLSTISGFSRHHRSVGYISEQTDLLARADINTKPYSHHVRMAAAAAVGANADAGSNKERC